MQALYAYFQSHNERIDQAEKKLMKSVNSIYDLYVYQLSFMIEIVEFARESIEIARSKYLPTKEELNPNLRFVENSIILSLEKNADYRRKYEELKINWIDHKDLIRRIFNEIKEDNEYISYMSKEKSSVADDSKILEHIVDNYLVENDILHMIYEEMNAEWSDDFYIACFMVIKTIKHIKGLKGSFDFLPKLFNEGDSMDDEDDVQFLRKLFMKTIANRDKYDEMIEAKVDNWEIDRIALMDSLIIKMALCEFIDFPTIPTKVTINEYIEISKLYSTPKSKAFVNGLLDRLLFDLTDKKIIQKKGRGLIN